MHGKLFKEYLKKNRYTIKHAADELGVSRQHLSNVANKPEFVASIKLALKIEEWTGGQVKAAEMLGLDERKHRTPAANPLSVI